MAFTGIVGHEKALRLLDRILRGDKVAHAYLLQGPEGVGKTLVAKNVAARLLCARSATKPCGICGSCRRLRSGNHPDFLVVAPQGGLIRIDQIRELKKRLAFSPYSGDTRVVLVEEAQTMGREAANSLLKILEEPPAGNIFLLVASESMPLPATIVSRCQVILFLPLSEEQTMEVLAGLVPDMEPDEARMLARLSGGAPGRALLLKDTPVLRARNQVLDLLSRQDQSEAVRVEESLALARELSALKEELPLLFDLLLFFFRDAMNALSGGGAPETAGEQEKHWIKQARERWNLESLSDKIRAVEQAGRALEANCNRDLVCETLLLELHARPQI